LCTHQVIRKPRVQEHCNEELHADKGKQTCSCFVKHLKSANLFI
jgi:hypothetical protein